MDAGNKPNDDGTAYTWLERSVRYEGDAKLTFADPSGTLEGTLVVTDAFDSDLSITFIPEKLVSAHAGSSDPDDFYNFVVAVERGNDDAVLRARVLPVPVRNPCVGIEIAWEGAEFAVDESGLIRYSYDWQYSVPILRLMVAGGRYRNPKNNSKAAHFVVPLWNFLPQNEAWAHAEWYEHPLRLDRDTISSLGQFVESGHGGRLAQVTNLVIHNGYAFIEKLGDYAHKARELQSGKASSHVTAVLIGRVPPTADAYVGASYVKDYLALLSLAQGRRIGTPWIEIRDASGVLLCRHHRRVGRSSFKSGLGCFSDDVEVGGISALIESAQTTPTFGDISIRALCSLITVAGHSIFELNMDDALAFLFRAAERIVKDYTRPLEVDKEAREWVKTKVTQDSWARIRNLRSQSKDTEVHRFLESVADQVLNSVYRRRIKFEQGLLESIQNHFPHEQTAIARHYGGIRNWKGKIASYRTTIVHEGWLDWDDLSTEKNLDRQLVFFYLHDVLKRLVLRMLGYEGHYNPSLPAYWGQSMPLDWITEDMNPLDWLRR